MEYFYTWGLLFVIPFTIFTYIKSSNNERVKMIVSGIGFGVMSVVFDYIFLNYWKPVYLIPNVHIEDFFYGFLFAGILPSMHNIFRHKRMEGELKLDIGLTILYLLILVGIFYVIVNVFHLNYIYALSLTPLIVGIISYIKVKGNLSDILITVTAALFITILVYNIILLIYPNAIDFHFLLNNISGVKWLGVPIEEWIFAVCLAVGCTYTYEALFNLKTTDDKTIK